MWQRVFTLCLALVAPFSALADAIMYYHNDLLGSPVAATNSSGQVIWREAYTPYGEREILDQASAKDTLWFTARHEDPNTELVYMGARYYDPVMGRFLSPDPNRFDKANLQSFNRYVYANNNPYKYVDPDGRFGQLIARGVFALSFEVATALGARQLGYMAAGALWAMLNEGSDGQKESGAKNEANRFPDRELPRDAHGNPTPDPEAEGAHTQLGQKEGRNGKYDQAREFDENGKPVRDIDFTDHGRPSTHPNPHQHRNLPNSTGGTPTRGPTEPLE